MKKTIIIALCTIALTVFAVWAPDVMAYSTWSGGCQSCHGNFRTTYTSQHDGQSWGSNLHDVHRNSMLNGDCNACHTGSSRTPVYLDRSNGGSGLSALGCSGCHGRAEDNVGSATSGAGLRQHHYRAGETVCAGCHGDSNPTNYTPVSEKTAPPFYFTPDSLHPNKPTSSCNQAPGKENYAASTAGLDNDGDGLYDANDPDCQTVVACADIDKDGYGSNGAASCTKGTAVDCNDNNAAVNPGAVDITCNGVDDNCSGAADEGYVPTSTVCGKGLCASTGQLACQSGNTVDTCVAGTPQTEGPAGNATCSDSRDNDCDGTTDSLDSNCVPACTPTAEVCDGKDNDCDGQVDEGITSTSTTCGVGSCASTGTRSCVSGAMVDSCVAGTPQAEGPAGNATCSDTRDNDCDGTTDSLDSNCVLTCTPTAEVCDGKDNDCDGQVDDGIASTPTSCGVGSCASTGTRSCVAGQMVDNCTAGTPQTEGPFGSPTCGDSTDNNCNGQTDATDPNCSQTCVLTTEVCDGVDNDCDGQVDEGITSTPTSCGVGSCASTGTRSCSGGQMVDNCTAGTPQTEGPSGSPTCGDAQDNDCDGTADASDSNCSGTSPAYCIDKDRDGYGSNGASTCRKGTAIDCNDRNRYVNPGASEVCDGRDNNCDGQTDEGVTKTYYKDRDRDGYGDPSITKESCRRSYGYVSNNTDCNDSSGRIHPRADETCGDNIDQNCNGNADEVCPAPPDDGGSGSGGGGSTGSGVPADHTDSQDGERHKPGKGKPYTNSCTSCHGSDLRGDIGPSCYSCHSRQWDETAPSGGSGSGGGSTGSGVPADHTDSQDGERHKPGKGNPIGNGWQRSAR